MALASTIINRALRLLGVIDSAETPSESMSADALAALNGLLADWALQPLLTFSATQESYAIPSSTISFTIGPTGNKVTTRPDAIGNMFLRVSSVDYQIAMISGEEYGDIAFKSVTGSYPSYAWYDPGTPNGTIYLWPGSASGQTLFWDSMRPLQTFAGLTTTVTLPAPYVRALAYNLAVDIAPEFGMEPPSNVQRIAATSKRNIKRANTQVPHMSSEPAGMASTASRLNILTGP